MSREGRKRRLRRRIARIEERLEAIEKVDEKGLRGPLRRWVEKLKERDDIDLDVDNDGNVSFEELVDAAQELADEAIEVDNGIIEVISDFGIEILGEIAVIIYRRTEERLKRRLNRLKRRLRRLESRD